MERFPMMQLSDVFITDQCFSTSFKRRIAILPSAVNRHPFVFYNYSKHFFVFRCLILLCCTAICLMFSLSNNFSVLYFLHLYFGSPEGLLNYQYSEGNSITSSVSQTSISPALKSLTGISTVSRVFRLPLVAVITKALEPLATRFSFHT